MYKISGVAKNSPAKKKGIKKGDFLVSINNKKIHDIIDYMYLSSDEYITLKIISAEGSEKTIKLNNTDNFPLGLEFETPTIDSMKSCKNKCVFCFIDQLPKNLRTSLYFKDDDYRLCFLYGNYITLSNASMSDLERIVRLRLSPVNISIHTTNPSLRAKMLNNKTAGDIIDKVKYLYKNSIEMQAQIVLCPGLNDGDELKKTLSDLMHYYPALASVSVVDVGLTKFRDNLYPLEQVDYFVANKTLDTVSYFQNKMYNKHSTRWVYCSDEIYIKAKREIPEYEFYEDFLQFQNGVGFISAFCKEFTEEMDKVNNVNPVYDVLSVACGYSIAPYIRQMCGMAETKYGVKINVYALENNFFGKSITCSGLLTAYDIINSLKNKNLGQRLLLPLNMFKSGTNITLDDHKISDLEKELDIIIKAVPQSGSDFLKALLK